MVKDSAFSQTLGKRHGYLLLLLFSIVLKSLAKAVRQEKEIKGMQIGKDELKVSPFTDDVILYMENPRESTKNLLELKIMFNKVTG